VQCACAFDGVWSLDLAQLRLHRSVAGHASVRTAAYRHWVSNYAARTTATSNAFQRWLDEIAEGNKGRTEFSSSHHPTKAFELSQSLLGYHVPLHEVDLKNLESESVEGAFSLGALEFAQTTCNRAVTLDDRITSWHAASDIYQRAGAKSDVMPSIAARIAKATLLSMRVRWSMSAAPADARKGTRCSWWPRSRHTAGRQFQRRNYCTLPEVQGHRLEPRRR
jgi:hypothetical protein